MSQPPDPGEYAEIHGKDPDDGPLEGDDFDIVELSRVEVD